MDTVHLRAHTEPNGRLLLDLPTSLKDSDVEVTITLKRPSDSLGDELGWPAGFWDRYLGSMPDFPEIEDLPSEEVEPIF